MDKKYIVIYPFFDLEDPTRHVYQVGDTFPHSDFKGKLTAKRVKELLDKNNRAGQPVIQEVEEEVVVPKRTRRKKTETAESKG